MLKYRQRSDLSSTSDGRGRRISLLGPQLTSGHRTAVPSGCKVEAAVQKVLWRLCCASVPDLFLKVWP